MFTSIVIAIIFINVIFSPQCIDSIKEIHKIHFQLRDNIEQFSHEIKKTVNYQYNADAWCNTLVVYPIHEPSTRIIDYPPQFAGLPAGFGTSVIFNLNNVKLPIKSKYIFTDIETINKLHLRVKLLAKLSGSRALFLNLDAKCKQ
jgi:hypothetical protein